MGFRKRSLFMPREKRGPQNDLYSLRSVEKIERQEGYMYSYLFLWNNYCCVPGCLQRHIVTFEIKKLKIRHFFKFLVLARSSRMLFTFFRPDGQLTLVKTRYPLTISRAQVESSSRSAVFFFEVDRWPGTGFLSDRRLKPDQNEASFFARSAATRRGFHFIK